MTNLTSRREFWIGPNREYDEPKFVVLDSPDDETIHVREVLPGDEDFEAMLKMKQDDWIEVCKETENLEKMLALAEEALKNIGGDLDLKSSVYAMREYARKTLAEIAKLKGEK